jgi:hypothetical protein
VLAVSADVQVADSSAKLAHMSSLAYQHATRRFRSSSGSPPLQDPDKMIQEAERIHHALLAVRQAVARHDAADADPSQRVPDAWSEKDVADRSAARKRGVSPPRLCCPADRSRR